MMIQKNMLLTVLRLSCVSFKLSPGRYPDGRESGEGGVPVHGFLDCGGQR